jgi:clan AA aspartic protease
MGLVYAVTEVTNVTGNGANYSMPFLVDTGATDTILPASELEKLGVRRESKRNYELADGSVVSYDVGFALLRVNGERVAANVVFGEEGSEPLLGVTVLESAGFIVDPVRQILKKTAGIALK